MNDALRIASVTGVDLTLKIAGPGARSYAFVIDWHIRLLLALAWLALGLIVTTGSLAWMDPSSRLPRLFVFAVLLPAAAIYLLYHPVLEVAMRGRTPGKRMAGVRIVMEDGSLPGLTPLLVRNVLRLLDALPVAYVVGLTATVLTRRSVRIGDLAAGTLLVYEDSPSGATAAALARDGDVIARLGLERTEIARELEDRWFELAPDVRDRLARRLLAELGDAPTANATDGDLLARLRRLLPR